jgi:Rap1a immunity proteins
MTKRLFVLILLWLPLLVIAHEEVAEEEIRFPQQMSARDLQQACASSTLGNTGRQRRRYCAGFISGVEEGVRILHMQHMLEMSICLPEKASSRTLTNIFLKHTMDNPEQLGKPAAQIVIDALTQAYPCTQIPNTNETRK